MRLFRRLGFVYTTVLIPSLVLANITPPPPPPNIIGLKSDGKVLTGDSDLNIHGEFYVNYEKSVRSVNLYNGGYIVTNSLLNGKPHTLTVGDGGITAYIDESPVGIGGSGALTSSTRFLDISVRSKLGASNYIEINTEISDNPTNRVNLRMLRYAGMGQGIISLGGDKNNTFTGSTEIYGINNRIILNKEKGAIAIRGDIFINDSARLTIRRDNQISSGSIVSLKNATFEFEDNYLDGKFTKRESFNRLVIEGTSFIQFSHQGLSDSRFLYLEDLYIADGGKLTIQGWREGCHFLLVRKTSRNLDDVLKKIEFEGYFQGRTHKEDYNRDYWSISGMPEPSTYGALFGALGFGLVVWRKRNYYRS